MKINEFLQHISNIDFEDVIKRESKDYLYNNDFANYNGDKGDGKRIIVNGLKRFVNHNDKLIFLLEAINYSNRIISEMEKNINPNIKEPSFESPSYFYDSEIYRSNKDYIERKLKHESQLFYAVRELEKFGLQDLNENAFTKAEVNDLVNKVDILITKINEVTLGHEVIYNQVDELKKDLSEMKKEFILGKKRWYQRFSGIVISYIGNKSADELYELLKPEIIQIIKNIARTKFLLNG